jgi:hypothetical protein
MMLLMKSLLVETRLRLKLLRGPLMMLEVTTAETDVKPWEGQHWEVAQEMQLCSKLVKWARHLETARTQWLTQIDPLLTLLSSSRILSLHPPRSPTRVPKLRREISTPRYKAPCFWIWSVPRTMTSLKIPRLSLSRLRMPLLSSRRNGEQMTSRWSSWSWSNAS